MSHPGFGYSSLSSVKAAAGAAIDTSSAENTLVAWPLRAGAFNEVGAILSVKGSGVCGNASPGNVTIKVYVGSGEVASFTVAQADSEAFSFDAQAVVRSAQGPNDVAASIAPGCGLMVHHGVADANGSSAAVDVDLRSAQEVTVKATMSVSDAGNTVQLLSAVFEIATPAESIP
jgi:hypothetical protein